MITPNFLQDCFDALIKLNVYIKHSDICNIRGTTFYRIKELLIRKVIKDINNGVYASENISYKVNKIEKQEYNVNKILYLIGITFFINCKEYSFHQKLERNLTQFLKNSEVKNLPVITYHKNDIELTDTSETYDKLWCDLLANIAKANWFIIDALSEDAAIAYLNAKYTHANIQCTKKSVIVSKRINHELFRKKYPKQYFRNNVYKILHDNFNATMTMGFKNTF